MYGPMSVVVGALLLFSGVNAQKNIVDTAVANNFTILAAALTQANLITTLSGTGPFTVFAPTDAAFAAALTALKVTKAQLLARSDLAAILTYHVVSGTVLAANLSNGMKATSLQGSALTISINGSVVKVNTATVTSADVKCTNGVIHIIDAVLLPPASVFCANYAASDCKATPFHAKHTCPAHFAMLSKGSQACVATHLAMVDSNISVHCAHARGEGPCAPMTGDPAPAPADGHDHPAPAPAPAPEPAPVVTTPKPQDASTAPTTQGLFSLGGILSAFLFA